MHGSSRMRTLSHGTNVTPHAINRTYQVPDINNILSISSTCEFESAAMELFAFQAEHCPPYKEYITGIGLSADRVKHVSDIPFLPIEVFKSRRVYSFDTEPDIVFTSSTTGGGKPSCHCMRDVEDYKKTFRAAFRHFYGNPSQWGIYALLPGYLEREGSSLIYMTNDLIAAGHGGFYLHDHDRLLKDISDDKGPKILLRVSYALLDLAEKYSPDLSDTVIMETGGMKGKRDEIPKEEFHKLLCKAFNTTKIHSEYGMAELTSQAYSKGDGLFAPPPWMKIPIRDLNDPFEIVAAGRTGGINILDLANISSCAFIQTQDIGTVDTEGNFSIFGRADRSEIRGCNLLVQ